MQRAGARGTVYVQVHLRATSDAAGRHKLVAIQVRQRSLPTVFFLAKNDHLPRQARDKLNAERISSQD
eukprot:COSAG06_NODE_38930_length_418_cov_0.639498_1_plen_67_part_01